MIANNLSINDLLSEPWVLPALMASALAVLFVTIGLIILRQAGDPRRPILSIIGLLVGVTAFAVLLYQLAANNNAKERRALLARNTALTAEVLAPGSVLACLDDIVGDATQSACEKAIFADPQSVARAIAYTAERLTLLQEAAAVAREMDEADLLDAFISIRHVITLDRYGFAAQILSVRDGCTLERCYAFALVKDSSVLKTNFKNRTFDQYVSRYSALWNKVANPNQQPIASITAPAPAAPASAGAVDAAASGATPGHKVDSRWDFPSAASIPPVDIMTSEPASPAGTGSEQVDSSPNGSKKSTVPVPVERPSFEAAAAAKTVKP